MNLGVSALTLRKDLNIPEWPRPFFSFEEAHMIEHNEEMENCCIRSMVAHARISCMQTHQCRVMVDSTALVHACRNGNTC